MKRRNRLSFLLLSLLLVSCSSNQTSSNNVEQEPSDEIKEEKIYGKELLEDTTKSEAKYHGEDIEVSKVVTTSSGTNIQVEGKDFPFIGTQIRTDAFLNCDNLSYLEVKELFHQASLLGVTCVQIPIEWAKIEIEKDKWDYTFITQMLLFANMYNLKVEFLWFGTNMCGESHSYTVPDYILKDGKTYPKFDALRTGEYWNYYGIMWYLDFDNENLIERETNAVRHMMDYIYEFDSTHDALKPVIGIQVLNEPDIFVRWRSKENQKKVISRTTGEIITEEEGYSKICNSLNALGKEIKNSKYKVYTRVNLASSTQADANGVANGIYSGKDVKDAPSFAKLFQGLEGIDIVGDDCYTSSVKNVKGIVNMFATKIPNNFGMIAENDGNYANTASLILASIANHGGYSIYDLITSPFFVANNTANIDQGIILFKDNSTSEFTYKNHYEETKNIINGIKMASNDIYKVSSDDFMAFNIVSDYVSKNQNQTISSTNVTINFETSNGALGYAIDCGSYIDAYFTNNAKLTISNGNVTKVEQGYYTDDTFTNESTLSISNTIEVEANKLYRIEYTSSGKITSSTWDNIGA